MAIYHFSCSVISRSKGLSPVYVAGRYSCEKLYDARLGKTIVLVNNHNVVFKKILLPQNAPVWMSDREKLWNAVEKAEYRKDSQLAREINVSLPRELTNNQNIKLATDFVQNEFVARGMVADLCIHMDKNKDGEEQPHAHVMLTMRVVKEDGFGLKERGWNGRKNIMLWRESWAKYVNRYLALNGVDQRIDHRSYAEQGIDLIPQNKIGSSYRKEIYGIKRAEHDHIARENGDRILKDPAIVLRAIACKQSTFTDQDLVKFIERYSTNVDQFKAVYEKVRSSEHIIFLGKNDDGIEKFTAVFGDK